MPLDPMFADAVLGTFRTMAKEINDKGIQGEEVDKMNGALQRMEALAQQYDDMSEFSGMMMQENLYTVFSVYYGRALSKANAAQYQVDNTKYDAETDQKLLNQTLKAYEDAIQRLRDAKKDSVANVGQNASDVFFKEESLITPIQKLIELGRSGVNYPVFLRLMIEKGMDKAMEGSTMSRDSILYFIDFYTAAKINPHYEKREHEHLALWDNLSSKNRFNVASTLKYNLGCETIDTAFEIEIKRWEKIKSYWENLLSQLSEWAMANMSFAHTIDPWAMAPSPPASVRETLDCEPGMIAITLRHLQKYFGIDFHGVFKHETFLWDATYQHMWYSQEFIMFLRDEVYPHCKPGNRLPSDLVAKMERIYKEHRMRNPEQNKINERYRDAHNKYFGEGDYERKNSMPEKYTCNAAPWNLDTF